MAYDDYGLVDFLVLKVKTSLMDLILNDFLVLSDGMGSQMEVISSHRCGSYQRQSRSTQFMKMISSTNAVF